MIQSFLNFELSILDAIYSIHNPLMDKILVFITHLGDKGLVWIILALLMCSFKKYRKAGVCMLIALIINLVIGNITLKPLVARIRPFEYTEGIKLLIEKPLDFSFPSGHTFSSFAASLSAFYFHKKEGIALLILAFLIAFSRLYLYVHFPSDVLCGALLGVLVSYVSEKIVDKLWN